MNDIHNSILTEAEVLNIGNSRYCIDPREYCQIVMEKNLHK